MHVAIYARVSTERQERQQTIDSQLAALRAWAVGGTHDLDEAHVFRDEGYSGARLDRQASMPCVTPSATVPSSTSRC